MPGKDDELSQALKQAKSKKMFFAFFPKGTEGKLIVSKLKIPPKVVAATKKEIGGGAPVTGKCFAEGGTMVFQVVKAPPATTAAAVKKVVKRDTGLPIDPDFRLTSDAEAEEVEGSAASGSGAAEADGPASQTGAPPAEGPQAAPASQAALADQQPGADAKTVVTKRLAALTDPFKEAVAHKSPETARMQTLMTTLKGLIVKHDYEQAAKVLDELEPLVTQFNALEADYKTRKGEVQAAITRVAGWGTDISKYKKAIEAAAKLEKTNVADALARLDQAKSEAEADAKTAEDEYQELKKSVTSNAEQLRDPKVWDHVKADLASLPKPEDADAQVQAGKGAAGRKILEGLVAPYAQAVANAKAYKGVLAKQDETAKKITDLEKDPQMAAHLAPQIADAKSKVDAAVKLADPPGRDYGGALNGLAAVDRDCDAAQRLFEEYKKVLTKKAATEQKIAALEKLALASNVAPEIAVSKTKVVNAMKLADPPGHDYPGALAALVGVDAACDTIKKMTEDYQRVLNTKADTDKKIARLENHPQKALIASEMAAVKSQEVAALALADPPGHDYAGAMDALGAVDKKCAAAEVKILDQLVQGKDKGDTRKIVKKLFKERFGVELDMEGKGDTPAQEYASVKRIYELMAMVPESHTNHNPSLKKIERVGGPQQISYYESETDIFLGLGRKDSKKVVLKCERPGSLVTKGLQFGLKNPATGLVDPPVEPACQPKPSANPNPSYFDWTTLHEIGHSIDDKQGFMKAHADVAGWIEYGSDCSDAAKAACAFFKFDTAEALEYTKKLMEGKEGSRPSPKPPAPRGRTDWDTVRQTVESWCDSVRVGKEPWENLPAAIGSRIYHEAYEKSWVSYLRSARSQAITGYQFRAPGEWIAELYAAYHVGVLKDEHPMVKKFLRDL